MSVSKSLSSVSNRLLMPLIAIAVLAAAAAAQMTPAQIAERSMRSTVQIRGLDANNRVVQSGTGFIVAANGTIVTNYHVVQGANTLQVEVNSGEIYDNVFYVTSDPRRDIALIRIYAEGLRALPLGSDTEAGIGEKVYVMGNPLGQTNTFSDGIVSAKRTMEGVSLLQITAPISSGSSGGPVMNGRGEVIGVATMGVRGGQNLNFAVPSRYIRPLLATGEAPKRFTASVLPPSTGGLIEPPQTGRGTGSGSGSGQGSGSGAGGNDEFARQVAAQLTRIDERMRTNGMTRSHNVGNGALAQNATDSYSLQLEAGKRYGIVGVCDNDCRDLDLELSNSSGQVLKRDVENDDMPVIVFEPTTTGRYSLKVAMANCQNSPCRFGVSVYSSAGTSSGSGSGTGSGSGSASSGTTSSSDTWRQQVNAQLTRIDGKMREYNMSRSHDVGAGTLNHDGTTSYTINLQAGKRYGIVGVCDNDCRDLDLILIDSSGRILKRDVENDDMPLITWDATTTGQYTVKVVMANCQRGPCRFAVSTYASQ